MKKIILLIIILFFHTQIYSQSRILRIMPVGGAITYDLNSNDIKVGIRAKNQLVSYRDALENKLLSERYQFSFVGSEISGESIELENPNHSAFPFIKITELASLFETGTLPLSYNRFGTTNYHSSLRASGKKITEGQYLDKYLPNVILLLIGMDDLTNENVVDDFSRLLETFSKFKSDNPLNELMVLVGMLPSMALDVPRNTKIATLNGKIKTLVNQKMNDSLVEYYIVEDIANISTDKKLDAYSLTTAGQELIADAFFQKIETLEKIPLCMGSSSTSLMPVGALEYFSFDTLVGVGGTRLECDSALCPTLFEQTDEKLIGKYVVIEPGVRKHFSFSPTESYNWTSSSSFSISLSFSTKEFLSNEFVLLQRKGVDNSVVKIFLGVDQKIHISLQDSYFNSTEVVGSLDVAINDGIWKHIVAVYDGEQKKLKLYQDGQLVAEKISTLKGNLYSTQKTEFFVSTSTRRGTDNFVGKMDELTIYNKAITPSEIMNEYEKKDLGGISICSTEYKFRIGNIWNAEVTSNQLFQLDVSAIGPSARYSITTDRTNAFIDEKTGLFSWTPETNDLAFKGKIIIRVESSDPNIVMTPAVLELNITKVNNAQDCESNYKLSFNFNDVLSSTKPEIITYIKDLLSHQITLIEGDFNEMSLDTNTDFPVGLGNKGHAIKSRNGLKYFIRSQGNDLLLDLMTPFSISVFFKTDSRSTTGQTATIFGKKSNNSSDYDSLALRINGEGKIVFQLRDVFGKSTTISSSNRYDDASWHHITIVRIPSIKKHKIYVDGNLESTIDTSIYRGNFYKYDDAEAKIENDQFYIGSINGREEIFNGVIDDLDFYTRVLNLNEIKTISNRLLSSTISTPCNFALEWLQNTDELAVASVGKKYTEIIKVKGSPRPSFALSSTLSDASINAETGVFVWDVPDDFIPVGETTATQSITIDAINPTEVVGVESKESRIFVITVGRFNNRPTMTYVNKVVLYEDNGNLTGGINYNEKIITNLSDGDEESQTISFSFIRAPSVGLNLLEGNAPSITVSKQPSPTEKGEARLQFNVPNNIFGTVLLHFQASDNGPTGVNDFNTSDQIEILIQINSVNDAPSFLIPNSTLDLFEKNQSFSIDKFITNMNDGEIQKEETLNFVVTCDRTEDFTQRPVIDNDGTLFFQLYQSKYGRFSCMVHIVDNGEVGLISSSLGKSHINRSPNQNFVINITQVNNQPVLDISHLKSNLDNGITLKSGEREYSFELRGINDGDNENQLITFSEITIDNPSLISKKNIVVDGKTVKISRIDYVQGEKTAQMIIKTTFEVGISLLKFSIMDNGETGGNNNNQSNYELKIIIINGNLNPTFTVLSDEVITVEEDSGPYSAIWVSKTDDGDSDKIQELEFIISKIAKPELFEVLPKLSIDNLGKGILTFTPKANLSGQSFMNVVLRDNGDANSTPKPLIISITTLNDPPTFDVKPLVNLKKGDCVQTIKNFLTNITNGDNTSNAIESVSGANITLTPNTEEFYLQKPRVNFLERAVNGELVLSLSSNAPSELKFYVTVYDSGKNDNNNKNTSNPMEVILKIGSEPCNAAITSLNNPLNEDEFILYPTLVKDNLSIKSTFLTTKNIDKLEVINELGEKFFLKYIIINHQAKSKVSFLPSGVYYLRYLDKNYNLYKKFIKL